MFRICTGLDVPKIMQSGHPIYHCVFNIIHRIRIEKKNKKRGLNPLIIWKYILELHHLKLYKLIHIYIDIEQVPPNVAMVRL